MRQYFLIPILFFAIPLFAQQVFTVEEAIAYAKQNHPVIHAVLLQEQQAHALQTVAIDIPKTEFAYMKGQYNSANKNDNNFSVTQSFPFPTIWHAQHQVAKANTQVSEAQTKVDINEVTTKLLLLVQQQLFVRTQQQLLLKQDSLFATLAKAIELRYETGESTLLEKTAILTQHHEINNLLRQNEAELAGSAEQLQFFLQTEQPVIIHAEFESLPIPESISLNVAQSPIAMLQSRKTQVAQYSQALSRHRMLPDLSIGYFSQTLIGLQTINGQEKYFDSSNRFQGFTVGVSLPLWFPNHTASNKAARLQYEATTQHEAAQLQELKQNYQLALQEFNRNKANLEYYKMSALPNAVLLEKQSVSAFKHGEVDYATLILNLNQALQLNQNHLRALLSYNQSILILNQLQGNF